VNGSENLITKGVKDVEEFSEVLTKDLNIDNK